MPNFVKSPSDEIRWQKARKAAAHSKGKADSDLEGDDFKLVNYIFHKMGKSSEDIEKAEFFKNQLLEKKMPAAPQVPKAPPLPQPPMAPGMAPPKIPKTPTSVPSPTKSGEQATTVKTPKAKKPEFSKQTTSILKSEEGKNLTSIEKLREFLNRRNIKKSGTTNLS